jgi:hypothetical protein
MVVVASSSMRNLLLGEHPPQQIGPVQLTRPPRATVIAQRQGEFPGLVPAPNCAWVNRLDPGDVLDTELDRDIREFVFNGLLNRVRDDGSCIYWHMNLSVKLQGNASS